MTIHDMQALVKKVDLNAIAVRALLAVKDTVLRLNKDQLLEGKDNEGITMSPRYASVPYANQKHKQNPLAGYGVPDLYKTGETFRKMKLVIPNKKVYNVESTSDIFSHLKSKYPYAFGLNKSSESELRDEGFEAEMQEGVKRELTL